MAAPTRTASRRAWDRGWSTALPRPGRDGASPVPRLILGEAGITVPAHDGVDALRPRAQRAPPVGPLVDQVEAASVFPGRVVGCDDVRNRVPLARWEGVHFDPQDRKSTRLNSSHVKITYAVYCLQ